LPGPRPVAARRGRLTVRLRTSVPARRPAEARPRRAWPRRRHPSRPSRWLLVAGVTGCAGRADRRFHDRLEPPAVGAAPVNMAAGHTAREGLIGAPGAGRQQLLDVGLADR